MLHHVPSIFFVCKFIYIAEVPSGTVATVVGFLPGDFCWYVSFAGSPSLNNQPDVAAFASGLWINQNSEVTAHNFHHLSFLIVVFTLALSCFLSGFVDHVQHGSLPTVFHDQWEKSGRFVALAPHSRCLLQSLSRRMPPGQAILMDSVFLAEDGAVKGGNYCR